MHSGFLASLVAAKDPGLVTHPAAATSAIGKPNWAAKYGDM